MTTFAACPPPGWHSRSSLGTGVEPHCRFCAALLYYCRSADPTTIERIRHGDSDRERAGQDIVRRGVPQGPRGRRPGGGQRGVEILRAGGDDQREPVRQDEEEPRADEEARWQEGEVRRCDPWSHDPGGGSQGRDAKRDGIGCDPKGREEGDNTR